MVEHAPRPPWRAGYVIVPVALAVGALQVLVASESGRLGWSGRDQPSPAKVAAAMGEASIGASQAGPQRHAGAGSNDAADEAAVPAPPRVFILHRPGIRNAVPAIQLAVYLQARGFAVADIRAIDAPIERPRVRYFSEADQRDSRRLAEAIDAFFAHAPDQAPDEVVDLSHLGPGEGEGEGEVEVWLPEPHDKAS